LDIKDTVMSHVLAIVGPTASGKTALSILLAEKLCGEIISADSRQIYKFLNIGTAKPTPEDLLRVPHHFIDILDPDQEYNAAEYGQQARIKIEELSKQGIQPIIAGGSGLYVRATIDGFFNGPGKDSEIREQLEKEAKRFGAEMLFEKLKQVDPVSAAKMDASKVRRVVRALEVYYTTGKPISDLHFAQETRAPFKVLQYALEWQRKTLYDRINHRVDEMIEKGLVEEVRELKTRGYLAGMNALNTVGYKETFDFIEGKLTKEEMVGLIKQNSRRFAKRQLTWFRADKRIRWISVNEEMNWNEIAEMIQIEFQSAQKNA
jgi:tRNA dimethylallyltransferase